MSSSYGWALAIYIICALLSITFCGLVLLSYYRNPSKRKAPAGLMLSKTISDLIVAIMFFLMVVQENQPGFKDNESSTSCSVYGGIFSFVFMTAQGYFIAICWDLWRTLSNPFRKPAADSIKIHFLLWILCAVCVIIIDSMNIFKYRKAYGICFTCNTGKQFSPYNTFLYYIPLGVANLGGVLVLVYAVRRLSKGLEKTFELRWGTIRRQFILVGCFSLAAFLGVITWIIFIYYPSFDKKITSACLDDYLCLIPDSKCVSSNYSVTPRILMTILVFLQGFSDAVAWFLLRYTENKKDKIKKALSIKGGKLIDEQVLIPDHDDEASVMQNEETQKNVQNVSNALRGEVIAYMTAGLANSVRNTAQETYDREYARYEQPEFTHNAQYSADNEHEYHHNGQYSLDFDEHGNDNEDEEKTLNKQNSSTHTRSPQNENKANPLEFDEPEPQNTYYPAHIHHDPKTHKGVINETFVVLPTQNAQFISQTNRNKLARKLNRLKTKLPLSPASFSSKPSHEDQHQLLNQQSLQSLKLNDTDTNKEEKEEENDLLRGLDVKLKDENNSAEKPEAKQQEQEQEEEKNENSIYDSRRLTRKSTVEMQENTNDDNDDDGDGDNNDEDGPPLPLRGSTNTPIIGIFGSLTRTISIVKETITNETLVEAENEVENTNTNYHTFNEQYSFYVAEDQTMSNKTTATMSPNTHNKNEENGVPFKDYAPHVFRYLRQQIYGISDVEYLSSVRPPDMEEQTKLVKEKFSEGRSGAFFFFTHDNKYIVKTVNKEEASLLLKILPSFVRHYASNPNSLINRFFGLHSITMYNLQLYFVVLENVFVAGTDPHEKYDIKGSWIDRHTNHHVESGKLMKDEDLHKTLKLIPSEADEMYKQLKADSKFLAEQQIMDYSVLLGIYYVGIDPSDVRNDRIMPNHHDSTLESMANNYVPPTQKSKNSQIDEELELSINGYPADLRTIRSMPDEYIPNQRRPRAPTYTTGIKQFAQKKKAVTARVIEGPGIYYLGIIDVLQEWNTMKKLENMLKVYLRCKNKNGISCVEPLFYRKRFLRKMYRIGIRSLSKNNINPNDSENGDDI